MSMMVDALAGSDDPDPAVSPWRSRAGLIRRSLAANGLDAGALLRATRGLGPFLAEQRNYRRLARDAGGSAPPLSWLPILGDRYDEAGATADHYFRQDLWVARLVHDAAPERHVDVGSRLDGFVGHLLAFREVEVVDVRPLDLDITGLRFVRGDGSRLDGFEDGSLTSLSSLHAVEHFGLGRYGDPVEVAGPERAIASFQRVLCPGGRLYLSVPVGRRRVEFNAHRVFDPDEIPDMATGMTLHRFSGIDDDGTFLEDVEPRRMRSNSYALGIYVFDRT